jgi:hypothetical protein
MSSTDGIDNSINSVQRMNDLTNLLNLVRRARNLIANLHNETTDSADDTPNETLTDTAGNINNVQSSKDDAPSKVELMIHHQFLGVELVSPVCAGNSVTCYLSPDQRVVAASTIRVDFNIDPDRDESIGALIYKLQKKNASQPNEEIISSEEEATCIQLVVVWKVNSSKEFCVASFLIEHNNSYIWNEDRLVKLAENCKLFSIQHSLIKSTWSIRNNTVARMILNIAREKECFKLETTISEGSINENTLRPRCINLDRLVSMLILFTMVSC